MIRLEFLFVLNEIRLPRNGHCARICLRTLRQNNFRNKLNNLFSDQTQESKKSSLNYILIKQLTLLNVFISAQHYWIQRIFYSYLLRLTSSGTWTQTQGAKCSSRSLCSSNGFLDGLVKYYIKGRGQHSLSSSSSSALS